MKKTLLSLVLLFLATFVSFAHADWFTIEDTLATNPYDGTEVVLNDCFIDTHGVDWLSSGFYAELDSGCLYQEPLTGPNLPWEYIHNLNEIDSWLAPQVMRFADANELATLDGMSGDPSNAAASLVFFGRLSGDFVPAWNGLASRLAFTPDAEGVWAYTVSVKTDAVTDLGAAYDSTLLVNDDSGYTRIIYTGVVRGGHMVPEPSAMLLGLVGLGILIGRRRRLHG